MATTTADLKEFLTWLPDAARVATGQGATWGKSYTIAASLGQDAPTWITQCHQDARAAFEVFRQSAGQRRAARNEAALSEGLARLETVTVSGHDPRQMTRAVRVALGLVEVDTTPTDAGPALDTSGYETALRAKTAELMTQVRAGELGGGTMPAALVNQGVSATNAAHVASQLADPDLPIDVSGLSSAELAVLHRVLLDVVKRAEYQNSKVEDTDNE